MESQIRRVILNLDLVLEASGASLTDIIKVNWYLTDISYFETLLKIRQQMFRGNEPASATIPIPPLAVPELLIEADAIAWLP